MSKRNTTQQKFYEIEKSLALALFHIQEDEPGQAKEEIAKAKKIANYYANEQVK